MTANASLRFLTLCSALTLMSACVEFEGPIHVDDSKAIGSATWKASSGNKLSVNKLSVNKLSVNKLSVNKLSVNKLSVNSLVLDPESSGGLEATADGRDLLGYITRCALAEGRELVVVDDDGETVLHRFSGLLGLAPGWEYGPLSTSEQRWLSACLMAHANHYNVAVPISLRGPHAALVASYGEKTAYPVQEAAFFGNLFEDHDGDGEPDMAMYSCRGLTDIDHEDSPYLAARACAAPSGADDGRTQCGFRDLGSCHWTGLDDEWSCLQGAHSSGDFGYCYDASRTWTTSWPTKSELYHEVITVYVPE